jgi:hypothetical protein
MLLEMRDDLFDQTHPDDPNPQLDALIAAIEDKYFETTGTPTTAV